MIQFSKSVEAWDGLTFKDTLKNEIESLDVSLLPLQKGLSQGSYVSESGFTVMILGVSEENEVIHASAGIFYSSVIAGCNCADDPTPVDEQTEYCEVRFDINKQSAETVVSLL